MSRPTNVIETRLALFGSDTDRLQLRRIMLACVEVSMEFMRLCRCHGGVIQLSLQKAISLSASRVGLNSSRKHWILTLHVSIILIVSRDVLLAI